MLRTNFSNTQLEIYKRSISEYKEKTGSNRLHIIDKAYDRNDVILKHHSALHDTESRDLSDFWRIYDNIKSKTY